MEAPQPVEGVTPRRSGPAIRVTPWSAFAVVGSVVVALALQRAFVLSHRIVGWAIACSVVALLLDPVVHWLSRQLPRVMAIVVSLLGFVAIAVVVVARIASELNASVRTLGQAAPEAALRLEQRSSVARDLKVADTIRAFTSQLSSDLDQETMARVRTLPTYIVTGVLMLFLLVQGRRYLTGALAQISDPVRRERARAVLGTGLRRGRNRLLLTVAQITVVTIAALSLFTVLDLRASFVLSFVLGVSSAMPVVGVFFAGVPAVVMAYGFEGIGAAVAVGVFVVAVEIVDAFWWRPRCERRTVEVGLFLPLVAALIGYEIYRIGGAVYGYALVVLALALIAAADIDGDDDAATWGGVRQPSPA
jgi:predicted PurR-regulated permease PerM